jgi:hypothetical protein
MNTPNVEFGIVFCHEEQAHNPSYIGLFVWVDGRALFVGGDLSSASPLIGASNISYTDERWDELPDLHDVQRLTFLRFREDNVVPKEVRNRPHGVSLFYHHECGFPIGPIWSPEVEANLLIMIVFANDYLKIEALSAYAEAYTEFLETEITRAGSNST